MSILTEPITKLFLHQAQVFEGLSLGFETRALGEIDTDSRAKAEGMAEGLRIAAEVMKAAALSEREENEGPAMGSSVRASRSESAPDPKPEKRIKNPGALAAVHFADHGCLLCGRRPVSVHHLLPRSLGGDDLPENLVPLCGDGVTGCHGKVERHDRDTCALLRLSLAPEQVDYLVGKKGWDFVERYFPSPWPGEDS